MYGVKHNFPHIYVQFSGNGKPLTNADFPAGKSFREDRMYYNEGCGRNLSHEESGSDEMSALSETDMFRIMSSSYTSS